VSAPAIVRADARDAAQVADRIAEAFFDLAAAAWLVPDTSQRRGILRDDFRILVDHAVDHGEIHLLEDRSAVAVWFHRDRPVPEPDRYEQRLVAACGPYTERFATLDKLFDLHHPTAPHHHLALLAVKPEVQGTGRGTALLRHHHDSLDAAELPAYLEASSTQSRDLYARHGYQARETFALPDGTLFWPMWRPPHRR
jgi:GNAT superfamily N-acetyltransferase